MRAENPQPAARHLARVQIAGSYFIDLLTEGSRGAAWRIIKGLPEGCHVVGAEWDGFALTLTVEGPGLPEVHPGAEVTRFTASSIETWTGFARAPWEQA